MSLKRHFESANSEIFSNAPMFSTRRIASSNATSTTGTTAISSDHCLYKSNMEKIPLDMRKQILKHQTPRGNTSPVLRNYLSNLRSMRTQVSPQHQALNTTNLS